MANIVFVNSYNINYLDVVHIDGKPVWINIAKPRGSGPSKFQLLERLVEEVRYMENELYSEAPKAVTQQTPSMSVHVGDEKVARIIASSVVWTPKGDSRYDAPYRQQASAAVLQ